ncbi:hypothetical protein GLOIN_2v1601300 [Rhizophagus irregularis DAOM 181602=DAOM 197198]|nr:hypothetical protein GLOIN_2v1601300 [Rhizophagus irregularis DAOM 181602=DAOM 197198]
MGPLHYYRKIHFQKKDPFSREYLKNQYFIEIYLNKILSSVQTWVDTVVGKNQEKLVNFIYRSLLEMFIENEGDLHSFEVVLPTYYDNYFDNNIDLILQNPNITYNISNLTFRIFNYNTQNMIKLLKILCSNCNLISSMILGIPIYDIDYRSLLIIEKWLIQIIISQHNLRKIAFEYDIDLYNPFLSLKNSNCSNTLNTIIFHSIDFNNIVSILQEIRYFESGIPDDNNIYLFLENNQHNINYLTIEESIYSHIDHRKLSSTVLQNLGQVLPSKLEYLCLSLSYRTSDLEIFLKNSQNTFIKKLIIKNMVFDRNEKILFYIKKYIMKKERVKYLAILNKDVYTREEIELFFLKDEVNEFKLHNTIVKKSHDLNFSPYSFLNNNYLQYE